MTTLSANLRQLSGGTDTQAFRERIAKKSGGAVSARTIGNMMSATAGNPTLANIEAVAGALGLSVSELLAENLGRNAAPGKQSADSTVTDSFTALSPASIKIVERLTEAERAGSTSPALFDALAAVLNLAAPPAKGYPGLDNVFKD